MTNTPADVSRSAKDAGGFSLRAAAARLVGPDGINSAFVWLVLVGVLVIIRMIIDAFYPSAFNDPEQASFFAWPALGVLSVLGLVGVYFAHLTGFPAALSMQEPVRRLVDQIHRADQRTPWRRHDSIRRGRAFDPHLHRRRHHLRGRLSTLPDSDLALADLPRRAAEAWS